mmetsp:Transcript_5820/g.9669  ORF Transcript_5820/g.9669 Transcript_5820/m.9669 type:complete len:304 (+) Transcript_5820:133-1044(+)|eukprot:CAMPEP_0119005632 /NCGR_PEP_ID=MMETSP1176-20130426/1837_1 /TAXON_ID=265551 /ORGANISM="Synedropsis recta cf, Strain CCMP1620" /LENGTH=303 /DNA_ID=CAMNT_0006957465 /DNA_START=125 /DNA_END=1036 /DNA_ORIENTATION=-
MTPTKRIAVTGSLVVMAIVMLWKINAKFYHSNYNKDGKYVRRLAALEIVRPQIYTFYSPLVRALDTPREQKTRKADKELLEAWKAAWYDAGWDPKVISLDEAKRNPNYATFVAGLHQIKLYGNGGRNQEYNEYCFLRFLAMASVGGGTMADYDLFPLGKRTELQSTTPDRFTVYQQTLNKAGPVPALCSGTKNEWDRIGQAILGIAMSQPANDGWSDMMALMRLYKTQPDSIVLLDQVLGSNEFSQASTAHEQCRLASQKRSWGVHFSHYDVLQSGHRVFDRPLLAKEFVANWNRVCLEQQSQ